MTRTFIESLEGMVEFSEGPHSRNAEVCVQCTDDNTLVQFSIQRWRDLASVTFTRAEFRELMRRLKIMMEQTGGF